MFYSRFARSRCSQPLRSEPLNCTASRIDIRPRIARLWGRRSGGWPTPKTLEESKTHTEKSRPNASNLVKATVRQLETDRAREPGPRRCSIETSPALETVQHAKLTGCAKRARQCLETGCVPDPPGCPPPRQSTIHSFGRTPYRRGIPRASPGATRRIPEQ